SDGRFVVVAGLRPPELILQDELHLIEGPLGSMVGLYETSIDVLSSGPDLPGRRAKDIGSTPTVRRLHAQLRAAVPRSVAGLPAPGLSVTNSFFARVPESLPIDSRMPGRLYVGVCAPGRGAQTPTIRLWSKALQHAADRLRAGTPAADVDPFWTLVGY